MSGDVLVIIGYAIAIVFAWFAGLIYSPYLVEKLFPKWSTVRQAHTGVFAYMVLTGFVLIIIGKLL